MTAPHQKHGPNTTTVFGDWLRERMDEKGLTQQELADLLGVTRVTVYRWMAPVEKTDYYRRPSTDNFIALGEVFGVSPVTLMNMTGLEPDENMSQIKRDTISAVQVLPDEILVTLYPQIRALVDMQAKRAGDDELAKRRKQKAKSSE